MAASKIVSLDKKKAKEFAPRNSQGASSNGAGRNQAERQPRPAGESGSVNDSVADLGNSEGPKSRKEMRGKEKSAPVDAGLAPNGSAGPRNRKNAGGNQDSESRPWVTSLFSANPESAIPIAAEEADVIEEEIEPEPVFDTKTFPGLGLNPFLCSHLSSSLSTKRPTAIQALTIPVLGGKRKQSRDRDAIIQAQTGSGKTLAYLLPIVNNLMNIEDRGASRRSGCFAIVLAPTRELARQIYGVLEGVLNLSSKSIAGANKASSDSDSDIDAEDKGSPAEDVLPGAERRPRWIVPGLVVGGDNKKSEKARIRKGINILVSTPGRLLDHLRNTKALGVSKVRWLVLDEADRLMELGFEETIREILGCLDREAKAANLFESWQEVLPSRRVTWLCSATMKGHGGLERLQEMSVQNPVVLVDKTKEIEDKSSDSESEAPAGKEAGDVDEKSKANKALAAREEELEQSKISVPNQLRQSYLVVPAKLRLVVLMSLLRSAVVGSTGKVIVFVSCQDNVDFLWTLLGKVIPDASAAPAPAAKAAPAKAPSKFGARLPPGYEYDSDGEIIETSEVKPAPTAGGKPKQEKDSVSLTGGLLPSVPIFRLHGNMPQNLRSSTFAQFRACQSGVLLCTDVAARGLDLPDVSSIVQYDPPSDFKDYVHRAGRTARLGRAGKAVIMLLPSEVEYLDVLSKEGFSLHSESTDLVLENLVKADRTGAAKWKKVSKDQMEKRATDVHMEAERWVMSNVSVGWTLLVAIGHVILTFARF